MLARSGRRTPWIMVLVLAILMAAMVLAGSSCGTPSFSQEQQDQLDRAITDSMQDYHLPGVVVGVWVPGQGTYMVARGESDLETGEPMQIDNKFGIGSVTKSFVGTVALQLVDEGELGLDDKLSEYISYVPNGDNITVRQLLDMTSGLYNYTENVDLLTAVANDPLKKWAPEELIGVGISQEPYFPPGEGWYYSNTNTVLVGLIIEKITGNELEDEVQNRIIDNLGLENTSFPRDPGMSAPYAKGYQFDTDAGEFVDAMVIDPSYTWAAGAMVSNLADLKVWAEALGTGELLSESMQQERLRFHDMVIPGVPDFYYDLDPGYGLAVEKYDNSNDFIGHSGKTNAYNTQMYYLPSEQAVMITLANTDTTSGDGPLFFATISKVIFPDSFPKVPDSPE
jgi:D-alanyl-D-alanine carboxypeptidase